MMEKMLVKEQMLDHFSEIAQKYRKLRTTDDEPIKFIRETLELPRIKAADVGCGDGRYSLKLFEYLRERLYLYCIDNNAEMLKQLKKYLTRKNIRRFDARQAFAGRLPFYNNTLDCIFTFNSIQHFELYQFLNDVARILREDGFLYIYSRTRKQNSRNIWGTYFPMFNEKETRLYDLKELEEAVNEIPHINMTKIKFFKYERSASIDRLEELAKNAHYSTLRLYSKTEFEKSLLEFKQLLENNFDDLQNINWYDENVMLLIQKE